MNQKAFFIRAKEFNAAPVLRLEKIFLEKPPCKLVSSNLRVTGSFLREKMELHEEEKVEKPAY